MERVSSNTSLMAAQISSFVTRTTSSTVERATSNVCRPTVRTATPSAKMPTWSSVTRVPAASDWAMASASTGSTPMTAMSGRIAFT